MESQLPAVIRSQVRAALHVCGLRWIEQEHQAVYLMAVGGAAYLVAQAVTKSRVLAFEDRGMVALYEFELKDMPTTVAVTSSGESVHTTGPQHWAPISKLVWADEAN